MQKKSKAFVFLDVLYLLMIVLPFVAMIVLRILFAPESEGVEVTGALIYFTIPMPLQNLPITESQVNSLCVLISIFGLCLFLTHGLNARHPSKRQHVAEWMVGKSDGLVQGGMGEYFTGFPPFIMAILGLSAFSSLLSLFGLYAPTSDINIVAGWAILVFGLITYYKFKCGPVHYLKSFADPALLTPLNVISEFATPLSMAFRHYGNVLSGSVIAVLMGTALSGLSAKIFGWLPGILGTIPFLRIGIPVVFSAYFDVFSGCLQAYIFAMLTMMYVSGAFPAEDYFARRKAKMDKKRKTK